MQISGRFSKIGMPLALMLLAGNLHSAERVTLSNGFTMVCDHHAQAGDRVRIFTGADSASYIEFAAREITGVETVPDPAPQPIPAPPAKKDGVLTPADLHQMLKAAGEVHDVDVDLLASVVKTESGGNPHAVSRTGARGLMQLMPRTANELGVDDSYRPDENLQGGTAYLDALLSRYHDNLALALAAYNAGPAAVDRYHGIPPYRETRLYVARVIHEFNRRVREREAEIKAGSQTSSAAR